MYITWHILTRYQDGFGVHTFRFVTADGTSRLIKWHWKTKQGKASLLWEEAQAVSGKNPDFHRADLFNAIAAGDFPEWDLAVQVIDESQAQAFGFDMLDPTKILPEEFAPLQVLGTFRLDQNPTNYFAEVEQAMVCFPISKETWKKRYIDTGIVSTWPYCPWDRL